MTPIDVRVETAADQAGIRRVTEAAFRGRPYADGDEQEVVDRLRSSSALALSLVAVQNGELIGQISFSPATVEDGSSPWFALGPVSVEPSRQGEGIGSMLINHGLSRVEAMGALGCILTGDPKYYVRFGFNVAPQNAPANEPAAYFQLKLINGAQPNGRFTFHRAFYEAI